MKREGNRRRGGEAKEIERGGSENNGNME